MREVIRLFPVSTLAKILGLAELIPPSLVFAYGMEEGGKFSGLPRSQPLSQPCVNNSLNCLNRIV